MKGNEAISEGAMNAGCRFFFGYPITPQNEVSSYLSRELPRRGGVFLQAESELAAINMVIGASAAGARAMTSSSSPGIALKGEGLSYLSGCDLPAVVVNVQRAGPGLGGIQPAQSDYHHATKGAGHGDFRMITLAPSSVQEMYDFGREAFDLADRYRITVMVLSDGVLGQMMEPVVISGGAPPEPAVKEWALTGTGMKRKRNIVNSLNLTPNELELENFKRYERYAEIEKNETRHEIFMADDAEIVVVAYGVTARVAKNAVAAARKNGVKAGLFRPVTLWPFPKDALNAYAARAKAFITAEMSMGQMYDDVELAIRCSRPHLKCNRVGGVVHTPEDILETIYKAEGGNPK